MSGSREGALRAGEAIARVAGTWAALAAGLLFARAHVNELLRAVARVSPMPAMRMDVIAWRTQPLTQWRSYCIALACAAIASLAHEASMRAVRRWPWATIAIEAAVVVAAQAMATRASPFLARAFAWSLAPACALLAPFVLPTARPSERPESRSALGVAVALQAIPLAWGAWITTFDDTPGTVFVAQLAVWSFVLWRATQQRRRDEHEALAGVPLTFLPLVGLLRAPRFAWVLVAVLAYAIARFALASDGALAARVRRASSRIAGVATVTAFAGVCAVFTLPYRFRDLPKINYDGHETGAFATVGAVLHGKLMMADAGLIYGPLRAYALALYTIVAGVTAEQLRLGQVVINHVVLIAMIWTAWRVAERRVLAAAWGVFLMLVATVVLDWVNYTGYGMNAFGWADLGRIGLPFFAAVGAIDAFVARAERGRIDRDDAKRLAWWGALAAAATLWAQEFGACTLVTIAVVAPLHALLANGARRDRARLAAMGAGSLLGGAFATFVAWLAVYALFGRAGLFLRTVTAQSAAFTSGSYGALQFPANEGTFLAWHSLVATAQVLGTSLEYVAAPGVYLFVFAGLAARAIGGRWEGRDAVTLAVVLFGLASFRFALGRSDFTHLVSVTLPAVVLLPRVAVDAIGARHESAPAPLAWTLRLAAACTAAWLAWASRDVSGVTMALLPRWNAIVTAYERPSSGPPYEYPTMPRGGDMKISPETVALIDAIRAHSGRHDPIFQHVGYMDGGEIYFLADRRNPTRYSLLAEFLTTDRQAIALDELRANPPKLVVGEDWGMTGDDVNRFLRESYHSLGKFGGYELMEWNGAR